MVSVTTALLSTVSHLETTTDGAGHKVSLPHSAVCVTATEGSATFAWTSGSFGRCVYTGGLVRPGNNPAPHLAASAVVSTRLTLLRTRGPQRSTASKLCHGYDMANTGSALHCDTVVTVRAAQLPRARVALLLDYLCVVVR